MPGRSGSDPFVPTVPLRISIVTPSFNRSDYLEQTIRSVLEQRYPNLEYVVIDGGSTDGSLQIVEKYAYRLAYWVSEPDGGQFDAINKGFSRTSGEIMAWINSDDIYCTWALHLVADIFRDCPDVAWLTTSALLEWNEYDMPTRMTQVPDYTARWFYRGWHLSDSTKFRGWIQQESTFWRRSLWESAGGYVDATLRYAGDFELWARFWKHAQLASVDVPIAGFRRHGKQKTNSLDPYLEEAHGVLAKYQDSGSSWIRLLPLARWLHRITGRGGRVFGGLSRKLYLDTSKSPAMWRGGWRYVI